MEHLTVGIALNGKTCMSVMLFIMHIKKTITISGELDQSTQDNPNINISVFNALMFHNCCMQCTIEEMSGREFYVTISLKICYFMDEGCYEVIDLMVKLKHLRF